MFISGGTVISIMPLSKISGKDIALLLISKLSDENNNENANKI